MYFRSCLVSGGTLIVSLPYSIRLSGKRCDLGTQRFPISGNFPPSVVTPAPSLLDERFSPRTESIPSHIPKSHCLHYLRICFRRAFINGTWSAFYQPLSDLS